MATIKTTPIIAAGAASALEVITVTEVVTRLAARLPPPQERIDRLLAALEERFAGRTERIAEDTCAEIERVAWPYSRHLLLQYDPDGAGEPDEEDPGWPEPDPAAILPHAAQVRQVSRLEEGACLIRIDGFESLSIAQPYLDAAFALARGATGIVLDLRSNVGGYPETVAHLLDAATPPGSPAEHTTSTRPGLASQPRSAFARSRLPVRQTTSELIAIVSSVRTWTPLPGQVMVSATRANVREHAADPINYWG